MNNILTALIIDYDRVWFVARSPSQGGDRILIDHRVEILRGSTESVYLETRCKKINPVFLLMVFLTLVTYEWLSVITTPSPKLALSHDACC